MAVPSLGPLVAGAGAQTRPPSTIDDVPGKARVLVLSDIGNEPDDQMSLTRFLVYSNEYRIEGLVPTTSTWQRTAVRPDIMDLVIDLRAGPVQPARARPRLLYRGRVIGPCQARAAGPRDGARRVAHQ